MIIYLVINVSDMQKHECISSWPAHNGEVYSVQFSTDELSCFSMGSDGKVGILGLT